MSLLPENLARRGFLAGAASLLAAAALPAAAKVDKDFWVRPRHLSLYRKETGEAVQVEYWANDRLDMAAYTQLCWLLRDVRETVSVQMAPRLLDLLYGIQSYVTAVKGGEDWLVITDGYRTVQTNKAFAEAGLPAARNSMHMWGAAADVDVSGLSAEKLGAVARYFSAGGVGVYRDGHVHIDTGRIRTWRN